MAASLRLNHFHSLYHGAGEVWDIGCDHGLLGLSFVDVETVKSIHLVDPSDAVISQLKNSIAAYTPKGKIFIHHQKGQDIILNSDIPKCLFIAGMGGKEMQEIAQALEPQLHDEDLLILSPHRKVLELRRWLSQSTYRFVREGVILEHGQFYPYICVKKSLVLQQIHPFGEDVFKGETGTAYLNHQLLTFERHQDPLSRDYISYLRQLPK